MRHGNVALNLTLCLLVVAYILYINLASYYGATPNALRQISRVFQNWVFRVFFLLVVGFFALELLPYGGFTLAVLLTIAFLNTNMLMHRKNVNEAFTEYMTTNNSQNQEQEQTQEQTQEQDQEQEQEQEQEQGFEGFAPFNPEPYRPDESVMGSGWPDKLPKNPPPATGPYTDSGVAYDFNMA